MPAVPVLQSTLAKNKVGTGDTVMVAVPHTALVPSLSGLQLARACGVSLPTDTSASERLTWPAASALKWTIAIRTWLLSGMLLLSFGIEPLKQDKRDCVVGAADFGASRCANAETKLGIDQT